MLAAYSFDRFRSRDDEDPPPAEIGSLTLLVGDAEREPARPPPGARRVAAEAANRARDLQNLPANALTPQALAERAAEIAAEHDAVDGRVLDREAIAAARHGRPRRRLAGDRGRAAADRDPLRRRRLRAAHRAWSARR